MPSTVEQPWGSPKLDAVRALADKDWHTWTETFALAALGWDRPELARQWAALPVVPTDRT